MRLLTAGFKVQVLVAELPKQDSQAQRLRILFYVTLQFPMESSTTLETPHISIRRPLIVLLLARTILDTGFRTVYPFLPFIALNLGVPAANAAQIVQVRNLTGFLSPLFGPLSDRYGRRIVMLIGLAIAAVFGVAVYFVSSLWMAILVLTLMGFSSILFVPAQQAFFGDNVPYERRGRVMAIAEFSWAFAAIFGLPLVGILVQAQGWRSGYVVIGILAALAFVLVAIVLPHQKQKAEHVARPMRGSYLEALRAPMAFAVIAMEFLLATSNEVINVNYAVWMSRSFGFDAIAMGAVGSAIGFAEFGADLSVALFVDRIGKWKMVAGGLVLSGLTYLLLPFMGQNGTWGTIGLVLVFFMFELTLVAAIPFIAELAPNARATLITLDIAGFALGRFVGSLIGPGVLENYGFAAASLFAAGGILVACMIWFLFVREPHSKGAAA